MALPNAFASVAVLLAVAGPPASPPATPTGPPPPVSPAAAWAAYRDRFIAPDGRVVDGANGGISHSEGQGYAMLLAAHHDDRATFRRLWGWTASRLRVRNDRLFAWKWAPNQGVTDPNDAADGDVLIAWALLRASRRWPEAAPMRVEALAIGQDVLAKLHRTRGGLEYLLPGEHGFEKPDGDVINPSYCVFPAFDDLGQASGRPEWRRLAASGVEIVAKARFGRCHLPPDWLKLADPWRPAPGFPARFGYDAVRVPLYLMWGVRPAALVAPFAACWRGAAPATPPAWLALDGGPAAPYPQAAGMRAIAEAAIAYPARPKAMPPAPGPEADYYDASLTMLTRTMWQERQP